MKIDYERIAEQAADNVADWMEGLESASMWRWVHADPARFDAWVEWATQKEVERLIEAAHEADAERRLTERDWRNVA